MKTNQSIALTAVAVLLLVLFQRSNNGGDGILPGPRPSPSKVTNLTEEVTRSIAIKTAQDYRDVAGAVESGQIKSGVHLGEELVARMQKHSTEIRKPLAELTQGTFNADDSSTWAKDSAALLRQMADGYARAGK